MKNLTALLLALVMTLSLASCANSGSKAADTSSADSTASSDAADTSGTSDPSAETTEDNIQIPNPWTDCETLEAAAQLVGFSLTAPEQIGNQSVYAVSADEEAHAIQALYGTEDADSETACVRKGLTADNGDDISGDYSDYAESTTVEQDGVQITLKGNDGLVNLALWTVDDYSFSVSVADGLSQSDMLALAAEIQ